MKLFQKIISKVFGFIALLGFLGCMTLNAESGNWYIYLLIFSTMFIIGMIVTIFFDDAKYYIHKFQSIIPVVCAFLYKHLRINSKFFKEAYQTKRKYKTYSDLYYSCFTYLEMNDR